MGARTEQSIRQYPVLSRLLTYVTPGSEAGTPDTDFAQTLLNQLPHAVFILNEAHVITFLNQRWEQQTGLPNTVTLNQPLKTFLHPDDHGELNTYFQTLTTDNARPVEARVLNHNGDALWVEITLEISKTTQGGNMFIGTMTDISERVKEEELLHASHRSLSALINDLPGMVYRCRNDKNWTMEYVSGGGARLTGYPPNDIINNSKRSYDSLIHYDDHDKVWTAVQSGVRERRKFDIVYRIFTQNNELKWVWERGSGIFSDDGELLGLEGYITDITADKIARDKLLDSQLYDPVTRLPNRHLFFDRLTQAMARSRIYSADGFVLFLIHFEQLSDFFTRYGETFQSRIHSIIAQRLCAEVTSMDSVACLQPDRYVILIENNAERKVDPRELSERIFMQMRAPVEIDGSTHYLACGIGGVHSDSKYQNGDSVIQDATIALDRARALGRSRFEMFDRQE